jgi:hypothetical protein
MTLIELCPFGLVRSNGRIEFATQTGSFNF